MHATGKQKITISSLGNVQVLADNTANDSPS